MCLFSFFKQFIFIIFSKSLGSQQIAYFILLFLGTLSNFINLIMINTVIDENVLSDSF